MIARLCRIYALSFGLRGEEDEHVWIVFSRERVRTVRRAVARFPSVVVGEVVEAIIAAQTNGLDAFVISESTGKGAVAIETFAGEKRRIIFLRQFSHSPATPNKSSFRAFLSAST